MILLLGTHPEEPKTVIQETFAHQRSQQHYLRQPKGGNSPNAHQMDRENEMYKNIIQPQRMKD